MAVEIRMPELSSETTEADIVEWLVAVGDTIEAGDLIAEFETDKSTVEFESPLAGVVLELCVPAPSMGIKVGELIARIEPTAEVGSDVGDATVASAPSSDTTSSEGAPAAVAAPIEPPPRAPATALARRIAEQRGVDLTALSGSGSGGRVTKADVEDASAGAAERAVSPDAALSRMQRPGAVTADAAVAFHLEVECDGAAIEEQCARLNDSLPASALEFRATDFAVAAVARALRDVPEANVGWRGESLESLARVDLSVAIERDGGLSWVRVEEVDRLGLAGLAAKLRGLADAELRSEPRNESHAAVVCLGDFGVSGVLPALLPPRALAFGIGALERTPVVRGDAVVPGVRLRCTLAADPSAVDEATAARVIAALRRYLEDPIQMLF